MEKALSAANAAWGAYEKDCDAISNASEMLAHYQARHPLWTPEMAAAIPTTVEAAKLADPVCYYRLVAPHSNRVEWLVLGASPRGADVLLLVWANLGNLRDAEVGSVYLSELRSVRGPYSLNVETDRFFTPTPLSEVLKSRNHSLSPGATEPTDGRGSP
jgi:hypothetical protein